MSKQSPSPARSEAGAGTERAACADCDAIGNHEPYRGRENERLCQSCAREREASRRRYLGPERTERAGFTPGPWTIQLLEDGRPGYPDWKSYCIRHANNVHLATVGNIDRYYERNTEANARLIAAAPSMYEALRLLVEQIDEGQLQWTALSGHGAQMRQHRADSAARAALSLAREGSEASRA